MAKNRLLLVEDDRALAHVLTHDLRHSGFEVECVGHGDWVLDRLDRFSPDLVLLDVMHKLQRRGPYGISYPPVNSGLTRTSAAAKTATWRPPASAILWALVAPLSHGSRV